MKKIQINTIILMIAMVILSSFFFMKEGNGTVSPSLNYLIGIVGIIILGVAFFLKLKDKKF